MENNPTRKIKILFIPVMALSVFAKALSIYYHLMQSQCFLF